MKKYLLTIILFILIIPTVVLAASTCNPSDIEIKTVTLSKSIGNGKEITAASVNDRSINLDVKLYDPNDYMEYTIKVKNNGTEDYYIKEQDFNNDQYLKYEFVHENNTFKIEPNEEKEITLRVSYKDRVEGNTNYTTTDTLSLNILDKQDIRVANTLRNIGIISVILLVVTIISIFIGGKIVLNNKIKCLLVILTAVALLIPLYVNASCDAKIDVDVKVELDNKNAIFDTGQNFSVKIKTLAGTTIDEEDQEWTSDTNITAFKKSNAEPSSSNKETKNIVSDPNSPLPIYVWFDNGTIWWWSEDETPSLNEYSTALFSYIENITDISGVASFDTSTSRFLYGALCGLEKLSNLDAISNWNTSNIENISYLIWGNILMTNVDALSNWDTSKVTDMEGIFGCCLALVNLDGIANWNTSKVTIMNELLYDCEELEDISALANWNTSNVTNMNRLFAYCLKLNNINSIAKWNTSKATNIARLLYDCEVLEDISALVNWDTSNVTDMSYIFEHCYKISDLDSLAKWNTSNVIDLTEAFCYMTDLTDISGIANWDVSKVTSFYGLFASCAKLETADLKKWVVSSVTNMAYVFYECPLLTTIDLTGWDTSNVTNMYCMFYEIGATVLDISNFNTRNVTNFAYFFWGSNNLTTIYIGEDWDTSANTEDPEYFFPDTCHLPNFSTSNANFNYITWAKPTTDGGYLTLKTNS